MSYLVRLMEQLLNKRHLSHIKPKIDKIMQKINSKAAIVAGSLLAGMSFTVPANATTENLLDYNELGSGSELRADVLQMNNPLAFSEVDTDKYLEMKCGEGTCGETKDKKKDKSKKKVDKKKAKEGKCGKDSKKKKDKKDKKAKEGQCGGGSC